MGNRLGQELEGKTVVFRPGTFRPEYAHLEGMAFKCTGGFGCNAFTMGGKIFGMFANGMEDAMRGENVLAIVPDMPVLDTLVKTKEEARKEYEDAIPYTTDHTGKRFKRVPMGDTPELRQRWLDKLVAAGIAEPVEEVVSGIPTVTGMTILYPDDQPTHPKPPKIRKPRKQKVGA